MRALSARLSWTVVAWVVVGGCSKTPVGEPAAQQPAPRAATVSPNGAAPPSVTRAAARPSNAPTAAPSVAKLPPDEGPLLPALPELASLKVVVNHEMLWVTSPAGDGSLAERANAIRSTSVVGDAVRVAYEDQISCVLDKTATYSRRVLLARIENARAFRLYEQGQFAEAARGFRRARDLDPKYDKPWTNLVAAWARAGMLAPARVAFAQAMQRDPVHAYERLLADEDLAPLRREFRTKRPVQPVLVLEAGRQVRPYAGFSQQHGLLAALRHEDSWGAENWMTELQVFDLRSGELVKVHPLVNWEDTGEAGGIVPGRHAAVEQRRARLNEALTALQFEKLDDEYLVEFEPVAPDRPTLEAKLRSLRMSLVAENDTIRLVRQNDVRGTFHSKLEGSRPTRVYVFPQAQAFIYFGAYEVSEGCDSGPETHLELFHAPGLAPSTR